MTIFLYIALGIVFLMVVVILVYAKMIYDEKTQQVKHMEEHVKTTEAETPEVINALNNWRIELQLLREQTADERRRLKPQQREQFDIMFYEKHLPLMSDDFAAQVDRRLDSFMTRLRADYPSLNDKEQALVVLYLLNIPDNDICLILNYGINSLPTVKNRLCKKIGVSHASELQNSLIVLLKNK